MHLESRCHDKNAKVAYCYCMCMPVLKQMEGIMINRNLQKHKN